MSVYAERRRAERRRAQRAWLVERVAIIGLAATYIWIIDAMITELARLQVA